MATLVDELKMLRAELLDLQFNARRIDSRVSDSLREAAMWLTLALLEMEEADEPHTPNWREVEEILRDATLHLDRYKVILDGRRFEFKGEGIQYFTLSRRALQLGIMQIVWKDV